VIEKQTKERMAADRRGILREKWRNLRRVS
jgi:hypothetical protein